MVPVFAFFHALVELIDVILEKLTFDKFSSSIRSLI